MNRWFPVNGKWTPEGINPNAAWIADEIDLFPRIIPELLTKPERLSITLRKETYFMKWMIEKTMLRAKQKLMGIGLRLVKQPIPELLTGAGAVKQLPAVIKDEGLSHVLIVTDKMLTELGLAKTFMASLEAAGIQYTVFDDVQPNPTIENIENGLRVYLENHCDGIVAFGGGSPMDCAKGIGARQAHPDKSIQQLGKILAMKNDIPPFFAVATTAGTGSEASLAAAITDAEIHHKSGIGDPRLIPKWAVLDPELTISLPPDITVATGMDALTHAVEAYISRHATKFTDEYAEKAIALIFDNLEKAYADGTDIDARNNMLLASYYAGVSFTRAMVGYVHAMAHRMTELYGYPHGLATAIILPYVLEFSQKDAKRKLARLAVVAGIGKREESEEILSQRLIARIREMNRKMNIPEKFERIAKADIPLMVERVMDEAKRAYAPPTMMSPKQCEAQIRLLMG
jgi:alcohol dehydrogenase